MKRIKDKYNRIAIKLICFSSFAILLSWALFQINFRTKYYKTKIGDLLDELNYVFFIIVVYLLLASLVFLIIRQIFLWLKKKKEKE